MYFKCFTFILHFSMHSVPESSFHPKKVPSPPDLGPEDGFIAGRTGGKHRVYLTCPSVLCPICPGGSSALHFDSNQCWVS